MPDLPPFVAIGSTPDSVLIGSTPDSVLIGGAERVTELTIESLGPQDDDLRVDVRAAGSAEWRVLSDTRLNVSAYNGFVVSPTGEQNFNPQWSSGGFRCLRLLDPGRRGDAVRVWVTDVGGNCQLSTYRVTVKFAGGEQSTFISGRSEAITPPAWPSGTISLVDGELTKTADQRPWQAPGSPAIWVPNGEFVL